MLSSSRLLLVCPIPNVLPLSTLYDPPPPSMQILHIFQGRLCYLGNTRGSCSPLSFSRAGSMTNLSQFAQDFTGFKT